jgi:nucleoporin NUP82
VAAKQEYLSQSEGEPISASNSSNSNLSTIYDYQRKYVNALLKQLPLGTTFPSAPRMVLMHPPAAIRGQPIRQGPFLLQPSPLSLEGSEGGDATDIIYLSFGAEMQEKSDGEGETERLGVVLVTFQDGKVDLFLDVEKVEARWERKVTVDVHKTL